MSARLKAGRIVLQAGQAIIGLAAIALVLAVVTWVLLAINAAPQASQVVFIVMPNLLVILSVGQILALIGRDGVEQAELLAGLRVSIDGSGISWTAPSPVSLRWEEMESVLLTSRRLWVVRQGAASTPRGDRPAWIAYLRRVLRWDRFALDAPLRALDRPAKEIANAIRHDSAGRFPTSTGRQADE